MLSVYVAVLVSGVGGFAVLSEREAAHEPQRPVVAVFVDPRVAFPQRAPIDFLPPYAPIDDGRAPPELRLAIVRHQLQADREAALARAARREAVRARAIELTVASAAPVTRAAPRAAPRPAAPKAAPVVVAPGTRIQATLSYYYCTPGASGRRVGDGGGFCGKMRNGVRVHPGAAACSVRYLGQRFRIEGDPTGRTYTCEDTGSAVHGEHRDIWFRTADDGGAWQAVVGQRSTIVIVP